MGVSSLLSSTVAEVVETLLVLLWKAMLPVVDATSVYLCSFCCRADRWRSESELCSWFGIVAVVEDGGDGYIYYKVS